MTNQRQLIRYSKTTRGERERERERGIEKETERRKPKGA